MVNYSNHPTTTCMLSVRPRMRNRIHPHAQHLQTSMHAQSSEHALLTEVQ